MPVPNPNERRPTSSGETPLQAAPPIPGAAPLPIHPEQRLGPAPALPVSGGAAAGGTAAERPLAHAPLPARPAVAVPQIPAAPAVPLPGPGRPGPQESPLRPVTGGPIGSRPEVPLARPGEVRRSSVGSSLGRPGCRPGSRGRRRDAGAESGSAVRDHHRSQCHASRKPSASHPPRACRANRRRPPARRGSNLRRIRRRCRRPAPAANRPSRPRHGRSPGRPTLDPAPWGRGSRPR